MRVEGTSTATTPHTSFGYLSDGTDEDWCTLNALGYDSEPDTTPRRWRSKAEKAQEERKRQRRRNRNRQCRDQRNDQRMDRPRARKGARS